MSRDCRVGMSYGWTHVAASVLYLASVGLLIEACVHGLGAVYIVVTVLCVATCMVQGIGNWFAWSRARRLCFCYRHVGVTS